MKPVKFILLLFAAISLNAAVIGIVYADDFEDVPQRLEKSQEACKFAVPEEKTYDAEVVAVRRKLQVDEGELFRVKVFLKNDGSMP